MQNGMMFGVCERTKQCMFVRAWRVQHGKCLIRMGGDNHMVKALGKAIGAEPRDAIPIANDLGRMKTIVLHHYNCLLAVVVVIVLVAASVDKADKTERLAFAAIPSDNVLRRRCHRTRDYNDVVSTLTSSSTPLTR